MNVNISVIIPIYKAEKYLRKCLDSVLSQDAPSFEVVAVNDGSPDSCGEILKEYSAKYNRLKVITQTNKGLGGARNTGIQNSKGKYLLFVDSDDTLKEGCLSYLYDMAKANDADLVCFGIDFIKENGKTVFTYKANNCGCEKRAKEEYFIEAIDNPYVCNKLYKAELFRETGICFPERAWFEDLATLPKTVLHCQKVLLTDKVFYNYLQRSDSIMHTVNNNKNIDMIAAINGLIEYFTEKNELDNFYSELEYAAALHIAVLSVNRVAATEPNHPLIKHFWGYINKTFPTLCKNSYIKTRLSKKRRLLFFLSKHKMYNAITFLNKLKG